ncbi:hypothetical protein M0R72_01490 [Candidatus Pacearchaeota archaeon]|jgi:hypothetical protein|nr:hypothetical protein [Candidatus Pacearchaeota archaeon]
MRTYLIAISLLTACGTTPAKSPEQIVDATEIRQSTFDSENTPPEKVDDDDDMEPFQDHLIQTTFANGLLQEHIDRAIEMLLK